VVLVYISFQQLLIYPSGLIGKISDETLNIVFNSSWPHSSIIMVFPQLACGNSIWDLLSYVFSVGLITWYPACPRYHFDSLLLVFNESTLAVIYHLFMKLV